MSDNTQQERYLELMYEKEHWNHESRGAALNTERFTVESE
jgi:hypothetical protein